MSSFVLDHMYTHIEKRNVCVECGKGFIKPSDLRRHENIHTKRVTHVCSECQKGFKNVTILQNHSCQGIRTHICPQCGQGFYKLESLRHHGYTHTGDWPFVCQQCHKGFGSSSRLERHITIHTKVEKDTPESQEPSSSLPHVNTTNTVAKLTGEFPTFTVNAPNITGENPGSEGDGTEDPWQNLLIQISTPSGDLSHICPECNETFSDTIQLTQHLTCHQPEVWYDCGQCDKQFQTQESLEKHVKGHGTHVCRYCDKVFNHRTKLAGHIKTHQPRNRDQKCHCGKSFDQGFNLRVHQATHTDDKPHACPHCNMCFKTTSSRNRHMELHTGQKPHQCPQCFKRFLRKLSLKEHMLTHTGEKPFSCNQCDKSYKYKPHLKIHMRHHSGQKPYSCPHCDKRFISWTAQKRHSFTHTGKWPYRCPQCSRGCLAKAELAAHMTKHTKEKNYLCHECGKELKSAQALGRHMASHTMNHPRPGVFRQIQHTCPCCSEKFSCLIDIKMHSCAMAAEKPATCHKCSKELNDPLALLLHTRRCSKEKSHLCPQCEKGFISKSELQKHMITHKTHECPHCGQTFSSSYKLKTHISTHTGEKPFVCRFCQQGFEEFKALKSHLQTHIGTNSPQCQYCEKQFNSLKAVRRHERRHTKESERNKKNLRNQEELSSVLCIPDYSLELGSQTAATSTREKMSDFDDRVTNQRLTPVTIINDKDDKYANTAMALYPQANSISICQEHHSGNDELVERVDNIMDIPEYDQSFSQRETGSREQFKLVSVEVLEELSWSSDNDESHVKEECPITNVDYHLVPKKDISYPQSIQACDTKNDTKHSYARVQKGIHEIHETFQEGPIMTKSDKSCLSEKHVISEKDVFHHQTIKQPDDQQPEISHIEGQTCTMVERIESVSQEDHTVSDEENGVFRTSKPRESIVLSILREPKLHPQISEDSDKKPTNDVVLSQTKKTFSTVKPSLSISEKTVSPTDPVVEEHSLHEKDKESHADQKVKYSKSMLKEKYSQSWIDPYLSDHKNIDNGTKMSLCNVCGKTVKNKRHLRQHMLTHTDERPYACPQCKMRFKSKQTMERHLAIHSGEKPHLCPHCGVRYRRNYELKQHLIVHTEEWVHKCPDCGKGCRSKKKLREHMNIHTGQRPYRCAECGRAFTNERNLKKHEGRHASGKPVRFRSHINKCPCCGVEFRRLLDIKTHTCSKASEQPPTCPTCSKVFNDPLALMLHIRRHGQKSHVCKQCGKAFSLQHDLKRHLLKHESDKSQGIQSHARATDNINVSTTISESHQGLETHPSTCSQCSKTFTNPGSFKRHMLSHTRVKSHLCPTCGEEFTSKSRLNKHMVAHNTHECSFCEKKFSKLSHLTGHLTTHTGVKPHICSFCQKKYADPRSLKLHMFSHTGEKPHECSQCKKRFTTTSRLKTHMYTHTGEKPYICSICQKGFTRHNALNSHLEYHEKGTPHVCNYCGKAFKWTTSLRRHVLLRHEQKGHVPPDETQTDDKLGTTYKARGEEKQGETPVNTSQVTAEASASSQIMYIDSTDYFSSILNLFPQ